MCNLLKTNQKKTVKRSSEQAELRLFPHEAERDSIAVRIWFNPTAGCELNAPGFRKDYFVSAVKTQHHSVTDIPVTHCLVRKLQVNQNQSCTQLGKEEWFIITLSWITQMRVWLSCESASFQTFFLLMSQGVYIPLCHSYVYICVKLLCENIHS